MTEEKEKSVSLFTGDVSVASEGVEQKLPEFREENSTLVNKVNTTTTAEKKEIEGEVMPSTTTTEKQKEINEKAPVSSTTSQRKDIVRDRIGVQKRPKFVKCEGCGKDIPIDEWPDHRDRINSVEFVTTHMSSFKRFLVTLFIDFFMWLLMNVYFREVTVVNKENIPKTGAVIFYGNHQNQFIDAMMIRANCGRPVRFVMAEKSFHRPIIGQFGRMMDAVPVIRPQDVPLTPGEGMLTRMEGDVIYGENTKFQTCLAVGDVIIWLKGNLKCSAQVHRIRSDTEVQLTMPLLPGNIVSQPVPFKISRRIDHSTMYSSVYQTLQNNQCIGIFPEGGSHDRTSLLPLKAGVALFSLGAAERGISVKVVPCGLTYFYGHKFRSRAHVEFGEPITPSEELVTLFSTNKREATGIFLEQLNAELRSFTINVPNWSALNFLHGFRQLYQPQNCILATQDYLRLTRRLSKIMEEQKDNPEFIDFRNKVENYQDYCNALLVRDSQAATLEKLGSSESSQLQLLFRRSFTLFLMAVILVPFFVVGLPIGMLASYLSERHRRKALSESSVKVVGADVKGSYKLLVGFFTVPIVFSIVSLITYIYTDLRTALTVSFSLPMAMYVSLLILQEAVMEMRAALPLFMSVISKHKQFRRLYERRQALVALTKELVSKWDPELQQEVQSYVKESKDDMKRREPSLFSLRHSGLRRLADKTR
ncbi:putative glycerol-3-phosphate acyltransferase [Trypanosoma theileri]|uniref:Putative glycerol-3-phosphate acyltransferase n=1 Tax=Trypanosoma theileri TaxID=67003 RepID=A0A1X0P8Y7_9TRYP|nr:putative glycerol-3-phosphate acyltransferase [Trypanosoma theileri]ORC93301.1 putative glycerol-3-phosphate acyltransferase [Trypanosoma theileri]